MANVVGVVLVGVEEKAQVAGGTVWLTVSATAAVTGGVEAVAAGAGSSGVSAVDPAADRTGKGNSAAAGAGAMTAGLPLASSVEAWVNGTCDTVDGMNALSGIAAEFSGKIPHARKPLLAVPGVAARPQASLSSDPN